MLEGHPTYPGHTRWTVASALRRAADVLRDGGPRTLWFKALGETVYRRLLLLERLLEEPLPAVAAELPLDVSLLVDARDLAELRPDRPVAETRWLMDHGGTCFVARAGGRVVSATWAFRERAPAPYLATEIEGGRGSVVLYDTATAPDLRGRDIAPAVAAAMITHYRDRGFRRLVAPVLPENRSSLHARAKAGFRLYGVAGYVAFGPRRWYFERRFVRPRSPI